MRVPGQPRGQRGLRSQQTTARSVRLLTRVKWEGGEGWQGQPGAGHSEVACGLRAPFSLAAWAVGTGGLTRVSVSRAPGAPTGAVASVLQQGLSPEAVMTFNSSGGNLRGGLEDAPPGPAWGQETVGSEVLCPPTWARLGHRRPTEGRGTAHTSAGSQPTEKSASDFFN